MAASATQNPAVKLESKSAKKKKAKAEGAGETAAISAPEVAQSNNPSDNNNGDGAYESPYIKELYKSIRNVNKKITNASKVDNILAENPGKTLDELVASRKINNDQKAQILKKPALQASLTQLEEQIAQYTKFDQEYKTKAQAEKADLEKTFTERASKELEEAIATLKSEAHETAVKEQEQSLLIISQFLRLAAIRRGEEEHAELEENKALEGLLAAVYAGTSAAVSSMISLIQGSEEKIGLVDGLETSVTYADLKKLALDQAPVPVEEVPDVEPAEPVEDDSDDSPTVKSDSEEFPVQSDPTIIHAGLTEIDAESASVPPSNGHESTEPQGIPQNSGFGDGANAAAEANWDNSNDLSASQEWVEVPRDAAETETGLTATPAAPSNTQSWADEQPDSPNEKSSAPPANNNDGFHEVQRNRGQNRPQGQGQQGQHRGRGGRGGGEGRGRGNYRGDGRGRGRGGGGRGGRGGRPENDA